MLSVILLDVISVAVMEPFDVDCLACVVVEQCLAGGRRLRRRKE